jgi:phage FluMu protein Com
MSIRYKCEKCGSTLNIKDELAGSAGKCPKCKSAFTVPTPAAAEAPTRRVSDSGNATVSPPAAKQAKAPLKRSGGARTADDDFDPMAVLMGDEPPSASRPGRNRPAPPPLSDEEIPSDLEFELEIGGEADEEVAPRKTKKRKRVQFDDSDEFDASMPNSASATAGAMLGGASAGAKDLLTRTMEESRARASRIDDEEDDRLRGPGVKDYVREYGLQATGIAVAFVLVTWGLYRLANSMYGGGMPVPDLGRVYGIVKLDGQPLEGAKVRFTPTDRNLSVDEQGRHRYRASTATTDAEGYYDLYYSEDVRGAAVTEHRVSIEKFGPDGRLLTPANMYDLTEEMRPVESGSNEIDFNLMSDAPPPAPGG